MTSLYSMVERPDARVARADHGAQGLDRRRPGRRRRRRGAHRGARPATRSPASTPTRCSTAGPAARRCDWSTASTPSSPGRRPSSRGRRTHSGNDVLLLLGNEPDHSWLAFSEQVVDLAIDLGARMVVGLGAYPTPVPHTRTPLLAASASSEELTQHLLKNSVEVPLGDPGDDRAASRPPWPAGARAVGAGAALRGGHAVPGRLARPPAGSEPPRGPRPAHRRPPRAGRREPQPASTS